MNRITTMENNTTHTENKSESNQKQTRAAAGVLSLLQPHDMSKTLESALHVFQGNHDKLPELMQDVGTIISKATKRFSTTQLILAAGAFTIGAILLARYNSDDDFDYADTSA